MELTAKTGLLQFLVPTQERLRILVVESSVYLPRLREIMPNAELYAAVADEDIQELPEYKDLDVHWLVVNYLEEPIPVEEESFDYLISERCLELAGNPQDIAYGMCKYIKETGYFLTTFLNVRFWAIMKRLMEGSFHHLVSRVFAKADFVRLLASSFFKDVEFAPQKRRAPKGFIETLTMAGFENVSDDLEVETWMVKAAKSTPEILVLKQLYTPEIRRELVTVLRRIEYGINLTENTRKLVEYCYKYCIFMAYLADFVQQTVFFYERFIDFLIPELDEIGEAAMADELLEEMGQRAIYKSQLDCVLAWIRRHNAELNGSESSLGGLGFSGVLQSNGGTHPGGLQADDIARLVEKPMKENTEAFSFEEIGSNSGQQNIGMGCDKYFGHGQPGEGGCIGVARNSMSIDSPAIELSDDGYYVDAEGHSHAPGPLPTMADNQILVKEALNRENLPPEKRIAFITCVNKDKWYNECVLYIKNLFIPDDMGAEIIPVRGATSMCNGYNRGMAQTDARYKIYVHQDCFIVYRNFIKDVLSVFENPRIGLIGTIGCRKLPRSGIWWDGMRVYGRILHACEAESIVDSEVKQPDRQYVDVEAVDGLILITQYDTPWREDLFDGWHFYDVSQCKELARKGYITVVPYQQDFWCIHCPKEKPLDPAYKGYNKIFLKEYGKELDPEV